MTMLAEALVRWRDGVLPCDVPEAEAMARLLAHPVSAGRSPDLDAIRDAGEALLSAHDRADASDRGPLRALLHETADLTLVPEIRQAGYRTEAGKRWVDLVMRIVDRTDLTFGRLLRRRVARFQDKALFKTVYGPRERDVSWRSTWEQCSTIAKGLLGLGIENPVAALYGENSLIVALTDLACLAHGIENAVVPANSVESQVQHIVHQSGASILIVCGAEQFKRAAAVAGDAENLRYIICLDQVPHVHGLSMLTLPELLERGLGISDDQLEHRLDAVTSRTIATTMYTSGTTGTPKGIRFSHLNIVSKRYARAAALPGIGENDVFLCFLPLYHTFGRWLEMTGCIYWGATYVFAESSATEALLANMRTVHPTVLISVPKKWRDIHDRVVGDQSEAAVSEAALRDSLHRMTGGRLRWGLSAAGRLDPHIFRFFQRQGVELLSGYGMTEATGGITMTPPGEYRDDSIGPPLPGIEVKMADDGELMIRGPYVSPGYTDEAETAANFRDGWFCTGDIVEFDRHGHLKLVDRKKDIYKNTRGRTVAPQRIEGMFADFPEIKQVFAVGDGREYVTLLIRPREDCAEVDWASMKHRDREEYFRNLVFSCNRFLAPFERVVNFALIDRDLDQEHGELTAKGSYRRAAIEANFRDVIEPMYSADSVYRVVGDLRIRVPREFLQHCGATEPGLIAVEDGVHFRSLAATLRIVRQPSSRDGRSQVLIGNVCYQIEGNEINLASWLRISDLWVGNADLTYFTGDRILLWSISGSDTQTRVRPVSCHAPVLPIDLWKERFANRAKASPGLLSIHAAAVMLFCGDESAALPAVEFLAEVVRTGLWHHAAVAEGMLQQAARHERSEVRGRAFLSLLHVVEAERFGETARAFLDSGLPFLTDQVVSDLARFDWTATHWQQWSQACDVLRQAVADRRALAYPPCTEVFLQHLLRAMAGIGTQHPQYYLECRREIRGWLLCKLEPELTQLAELLCDKLTDAFRAYLGPSRTTASAPDDSGEYGWSDTLQFEEGLDPDDMVRMTEAFRTTPLVREAVYLLYDRRRVDLEDFYPRGIWVSMDSALFGRAAYHAAVRLRGGERCDFTILIRKTMPEADLRVEMRLMTVFGGVGGTSDLVTRFGEHYPEYDMLTTEWVQGEPVEELVRHMVQHPDRDVRRRLKDVWEHVAWNALTGAFDFYRRTGRRYTVSGSLPKRVSVTLHDYHRHVRFISVAGSRPCPSALELVWHLKHEFNDRIDFLFPAMGTSEWLTVLFHAALESFGQEEGLDLLRSALSEVQRLDSPSAELRELGRAMREYIAEIEKDGYRPKAVHFGVRRYRRWVSEVPEATPHARAAELKELEHTYAIDEVTRRFPDARLRFYAETVLADAPPEVLSLVFASCRVLRGGADNRQTLGRLFSDLQGRPLGEEVRYFVTRAAYPNLDLDQKAELVTLTASGADLTVLSTTHTDASGAEINIRWAISSREIDAAHRIFFGSHLTGRLSTRDRYLVALNRNDVVLGALCYVRRSPVAVFLDKIAVLPSHRGRGIGRLLMTELIRRLRGESPCIINARFLTRMFIEQFGFRPHPRYPGLTLVLQPEGQNPTGITAGSLELQ